MGSVSGTIAFETIKMGRLEVSSQVFALVSESQGLGLSITGNSGILGLSFPSIASISRSAGSTFLENILSAFDEPDRFFAFNLGRGSGLSDTSSSLTIGELDRNVASNLSMLSFFSVSKAGADTYNYWKLPLQSLTIDNTTFRLSSSLVSGTTTQVAVLDTGTTLILGPTRDIDAFWRTVDDEGATRKNKMTGLWEVRCDRGISVDFLLGDQGQERPFPVDPADINWKDVGEGGGWCLGGVQANDGVNSGDWLLGDVFLRNVYVTHHLGNSTHQPLIGLLSLTDASASLLEFHKQRGPEQAHTTRHWTQQDIHNEVRSTVLIYVVSTVCGFVVGALVTLSVGSQCNHYLFS
ncbi:hypothetical protein DXG01_001067 [Tephrocybe rancida]|nr:hypothetical protein DXG01_001067 [Tephrocybe rancida]